MARSVRNNASTEALSFGLVAVRSLGCLLVCLFSMGCNNGRQLQTDLYQRELRLQEDKIYQLQDCVEEYQAIIRGYRMEVADLKSSDLSGSKGNSTKSIKKSSNKILPLDGPSSRDSANTTSPVTPELEFRSPNETNSILDEAPQFEEEAPLFDPSAEALPMPEEAASEVIEEAPLFVPQSYDGNEDESPLIILSGTSPELDADTSNELVLDDVIPLPSAPLKPLKSLGKGFILSAREEVGLELRNGSPEPTGGATLLATLHLFSESFDLANFEGELSFMLADQTSAGTPNRIARWDFTPSEVQQAWKLQQHAANESESSQLTTREQSRNKTIELPLLLPNRLPTDRTLEMWVRVVEPSGKKRLTKIEADFLSNPLRLINAEPLAEAATPATKMESATDIEQVAQNQWRRARADRLEPTASEIQQVTFESPAISSDQ